MKTGSPKILRFNSLASTNQKLIDLNRESYLPEFTVVVASEQTSGRGQVGNSWESEPGKNLTFSIIVRPDFLPIQQQFRITQVITLALIKLLRPILPQVRIKWPNDIYCGEKKIAGILVENSLKGSKLESSIIGVGLNVNQEIFLSDAKNPASMKQLTDKEFELNKLLNELTINFIEIYIDWQINRDDNNLHQNYLQNLYRGKGTHLFSDTNGKFEAEIAEIKPSGHLILKTTTGEQRTYAFKEVSFI